MSTVDVHLHAAKTSMTINVQCEECDTVLSVTLDCGWAEGRCSYCGTEIEVEYADGDLASIIGGTVLVSA